MLTAAVVLLQAGIKQLNREAWGSPLCCGQPRVADDQSATDGARGAYSGTVATYPQSECNMPSPSGWRPRRRPSG